MPPNPTQDGAAEAGDPAVQVWRPAAAGPDAAPAAQREVGGRKDGTEPTRFGDWEKQGRCIDF
jgi:hypothetical protein